MNRSLRMTAALALGLAFLARNAGASEATAESTADTSLTSEVENYLAAAESGDDPTTFRAFWKEGPKLETSDGKFKAALFGRVFWDTAWKTSDDFDQGVTEDQTFFRTVRIGFSADILKNAFIKVEIDFIEDDDGVQLKDVEMGLRKLGFLGTMKAGHYKEPFSLEELTSSRFITFMERSTPTSTFAPSRNDGISFANDFGADKQHTWAAGIFKATNNQGHDLEDDAVDGGYDFTFRVTGQVLRDEESRRYLHIGFGLSYRDPTNEEVRFRARPGVSKGDRLVDTSDISADELILFCFEVAFNIQSFNVQAEYFMADVSAVSGVGEDVTFGGFYIQFSYWLTGEQRNYKGGKYDRVKVQNSFHDGGGNKGAIELAFRYDMIDLSDGGIAGGEMVTYTGGANWHWNANMRVMFNVVFADADPTAAATTGDVTVFEMRFQFDF